MENIRRICESLVSSHLKADRQMLFFFDPRQVVKATLCSGFQTKCFNWDYQRDRELILSGEDAVVDELGLSAPRAELPTVTFDEIHQAIVVPARTFLSQLI